MKRVQLIEIAVLAVALIFGYKFFESFFTVIVRFLYEVTGGFGDSWVSVLVSLFVSAIYFGLFILLVKKSKWIAGYIDSKGQLKPELLPGQPEKINIHIQQSGLLYIILVVLCLSTILFQIPTILIYAYDYFKRVVGGEQKEMEAFGKSMEFIEFKIAAVTLVVTVVVLFYAKPIAEWFTRSTRETAPVIETPDKS
jgi:hypothetical protein